VTALSLVVGARVPAAGVSDFQAYEAAVLPLLTEHGGMLERRLRGRDALVEVHLIRFVSRDGLEAFRHNPRRQEAAPLLARSGAMIDVLEVEDVN